MERAATPFPRSFEQSERPQNEEEGATLALHFKHSYRVGSGLRLFLKF